MIAASLTACIVTLPCFAAEPPARAPVPVLPDPNGWTITLDANVSLESDYPGAATRRLQYLPGVSIRRAGTAADFSSPDDGLDFSIYDEGWLKAGPVAKIVGSRSIHGNPELRGLREVGTSLEAGGFVEYWPMANLRTRAELRQGITGHQSLVGTLGADLIYKPGAFTFSGGPRLNFGSGQYMRKFFSISVPEALANGRVTAFDARSGASSVGALGAAAYEFSPTWTGTLWGGYQRLVGDAGRSPIPRVLGSRNQGSFGATVSYSFNVKGL